MYRKLLFRYIVYILLIFHSEVVAFFIFNNIFYNKFYSFVAQKKVWQTFVQSSVAKRISKHKNRKKIISNPQSIIKFPSKWLESMNTLLFLTKRFDWGTTTTIYLCDAMWPSPSLSQFSAWSENIYGKHHCQIHHQSIKQLLNNPFVMWITRNCVTCNL